ncbi:hypothetical protein [Mycolicibacterium sp.]
MAEALTLVSSEPYLMVCVPNGRDHMWEATTELASRRPFTAWLTHVEPVPLLGAANEHPDLAPVGEWVGQVQGRGVRRRRVILRG